MVGRYDYPNVTNLAWHPYENLVSFTTSDGELFIYGNLVPIEFSQLLELPLQSAPFIHDRLVDESGLSKSDGDGVVLESRRRRRASAGSLDDLLGPESGDEDTFVSDDDGAGYLEEVNGYGKRTNGHLDPIDGFDGKRRATHHAWQPKIHESFQPGSTPWRGLRKYLCKVGERLALQY